MEAFEKDVYQGNLADAISKVQGKPLQSFNNVRLSIGVVGEQGSGKSSFINTVLGLEEDDPRAAETGVQMTTVKAKDYCHPELPQVVLWDLPGVGASPFNSHVEPVDLKQFDFFIIVSFLRFRSSDASLVHEIQNMGKKFYFVRTKADLDLNASRRQRPSSYEEEKVLQDIKENCRASLTKEGVSDPQVFIISNKEPNHFDFPLLQGKLKSSLLSLKRHAFLLRLLSNSSSILEKKKAAMKIWPWLLFWGIPIPGLSFVLALLASAKYRSRCYRDFGLDDQGLTVLAKLVEKPVADFKAVMKSQARRPMILWSLPYFVGASAMIVEYRYRQSLPIFSCILSGGISLPTTYFMLQKCLSDIAKDTQIVLAKALQAEGKKSI